MRRRLFWLACLLAVLAATPATAAQRLALVIGNAAYAGHPLATAANDAGLVAQALAQAGYEVSAGRDLDGRRLRAALHAFADRARDAGADATILVYLAGIGVQYDGNNYMLPVDAALAHDDDVPLQGADLGDLSRALEATAAKSRLLLYDLARASPLATTDEMPLAPGLALAAPSKDTLIGFAAAPGMVAPSAPLPYGPYARALAEALGQSGLGAEAMLQRVRLRVATLTDGAQIPWDTGASGAPLDQTPAGGPAPDVAFADVLARDSLDGYADFLRAVPDGPLAARVRVLLALRREATTWRAVAAADDPRAAWTYMRRYPRGPHRFDARRRLAALKAQLEPPPRFDPFVFPEVPPPADGELALVSHPREAQRGLPPIPAPPASLLPPAATAFAEELPMPTPAPGGLLPVAPSLARDAAGEPGKISQGVADGEVVTETDAAPDGSGTLTLSDDKGMFLTFATNVEANGTRVTVETGPKGDVKSRTTTTHAGDTTTIVLADAAGTALMRMVSRNNPDGSRATRVTDGDGTLLASWHRDGAGIVVASESSETPPHPVPIVAAPVPAAPTSPTVAVPTLPKPQLVPPAKQVPVIARPAPAAPPKSAPAAPASPAAPIAAPPAAQIAPPSMLASPSILAPPPPSPAPASIVPPAAPPAAPAPVAPPVLETPPAAPPPAATPVPLPPPRPAAVSPRGHDRKAVAKPAADRRGGKARAAPRRPPPPKAAPRRKGKRSR